MMARRKWADLSQEQRERLQRDGLSQADWDAGANPAGNPPADPPRDPPDDPPDNETSSDDFPDPDELEDAVNDPDGHSAFWWARGDARIHPSARNDLEDKALRNLGSELGDAEKFSRIRIEERWEKAAQTGRPLTGDQLRLLGAMDASQMARMARWANQVLQRTGSKSFMWLFYH